MGIDKVTARAVFLDRDGVLNRNIFNPDTGAFESPLRADDVIVPESVVPALLELQRAGFLLILVSNQPNYAKGKATLETLDAIHRRVFDPIEGAGVTFAAVHYCLHHPEGVVRGYSGTCDCRKPSPRFLLDDEIRLGLDFGQSWMVGDRDTDMQCGSSAGVRTIRVMVDDISHNGSIRFPAEFEAADLFEAAQIILATKKRFEAPQF